MMLRSVFGLVVLLGAGVAARGWPAVTSLYGLVIGAVWFLFALFVLNFFRDPDPRTPGEIGLVVSPAHGTVDVIDEAFEPEFIGGACRRISIFLSVFDVHVQNTPVSGEVAYLKHSPGKFLNALKVESALHNENVLIGIQSSEITGEKVAMRLIAGLIARRILPWIGKGDEIDRGQRVSMIQFGSRVDCYLPLSFKVRAALGDKVRGGETVIATRD